jgi:hypothetical protein
MPNICPTIGDFKIRPYHSPPQVTKLLTGGCAALLLYQDLTADTYAALLYSTTLRGSINPHISMTLCAFFKIGSVMLPTPPHNCLAKNRERR